jgi:hypothetical protein
MWELKNRSCHVKVSKVIVAVNLLDRTAIGTMGK